MKKLFPAVLISLILAAILFIASQVFGIEWVTSNYAIVTIQNKSSKNIKRLVLNHNRGLIQADRLPPKNETRFIFENGSSENTYKVLVFFDNDSTISTNEIYFEYGYRATVTITDSGIVTKD